MAKKSKKKRKTPKLRKPLFRRLPSPSVEVSRDCFIVIEKHPFVRPGSTHVFDQQTIWWVNIHKHTVKVTVSDNRLVGRIFELQIDPNDMDQAPAPVDGATAAGLTFKYKVHDVVDNVDIPGNSRPEIIVEG